MIILKRLSWDNCFSYGTNNSINFNNNPITQLVGKNGHGKSSIGLILEEVLYNKNSKGVKKGDILNRYSSAKSYSIELEFEKDGSTYTVKTSRGTSQTVKLYKDGEDISSHTATNTFKSLEEILGIDHKTFSQLIYQSSSSSLEFLVATDTNRKKFLIDLLGLGRYTELHDTFKSLVKDTQESLANISGKINVINGWLDRNNKVSLEELPISEVEEVPVAEQDTLASIKLEIANIDSTNRKISDNNKYIELISNISSDLLSKQLEVETNIDSIRDERANLTKTIKDANTLIDKISKLGDKCPTCLQEVDKQFLASLVIEQENFITKASESIKVIDEEINKQKAISTLNSKVREAHLAYEKYYVLIDKNLPKTPLDKEDLINKASILQNSINETLARIKSIISSNTEAHSHNSKIASIKEQMAEMQKELSEYTVELNSINNHLAILNLLQKTFSTNGIVAYKIECLVKDLESLTNGYLAELSSGRFQLTFKVVSDKLNVIITDNGKDIDILALSGGERSRVNTSTLLAIRKLMQSLSNSRINLLILDETIDSLDTEGKEKLIEVLLKEEHLNTILVSHGFSHPLLEKLLVVKEHNISRIE